MTTLETVALATCGLVWVAAIVEFVRTWAELGQGRAVALRINRVEEGRK